jgi:adenylate kinase family enzyme
MLVDGFQFHQVAMSALLMAAQDSNSRYKEIISRYSVRGELVPDEVTLPILERHVLESSDKRRKVFDGMPRNPKQARFLHNLLSKQEIARRYIVFQLSQEECEKRIADRVEEDIRAGRKPRDDDLNPAAVSRRLTKYFAELDNIIRTLQGMGMTIDHIDARPKPAIVSARVRQVLYNLDPSLRPRGTAPVHTKC